MKTATTLLLLSFFFLTSFAPIKGMDDVIGALQSGNTNRIARYIDDNVDLSLPQSKNCYSKTQALMVLDYFFDTNGVTGFDVKHKSQSSQNPFCIGVLHTRSGDYRTTIFMKDKSSQQLMREIRFQPM